MQIDYQKIKTELTSLLKNYSNVTRATVNPFRLENERLRKADYLFVPGDKNVQETLMEHVGTLPVLAVYFHSHIEEEVDLGKALSMLAIHDIGELVLGDKNVFIKGSQDDIEEKEAALNLLDTRYHNLYLEYEERKTLEAKFAKSVDKIASDILDVLTDRQVTTKRLKHFANLEPEGIALIVEAKKSPYMQWSTFFKSFHFDLMEELKEMFPPKK